jgi:glycosyltransferase involved in cell wall biosynthesis
MKRVTVVIPTFNRKEILTKAIRAHLAQSALSETKEILVVDDGSTDGTEARVLEFAADSPVSIHYWQQSKRGQASARNLGIREAKGEIILFTDDDIIPAPDCVAEHLRWHDRHPELHAAVLGYVTWCPDVRPTPFMRWFGLDGPLFAYAHFHGKSELDFRAFYTCNLSLKTDFLRRTEGFDEEFKGYGYEDTELGYRLQKNGMRLLYNPRAVGYHYKHVKFADACHRAQQVAVAFPIFERKEAGKYLLDLQGRECSPSQPRGFVRRMLVAGLRPFKTLILSPFRLIVDSQFPLPWTLYRRLYAEAVARKVPG